jgi:hypothetical protein
VEPGLEYDRICEELSSAFLSFHDIGSGKPIMEKVFHIDYLAPFDAPYRNFLPDLVITWTDISAIQSRGIRSDKYGDMKLNGKLPSDRAGNHTGKGWFVAFGEGIPPETPAHGYQTIDLAPTIFHWLGIQPPEHFQGKPIPVLCNG